MQDEYLYLCCNKMNYITIVKTEHHQVPRFLFHYNIFAIQKQMLAG